MPLNILEQFEVFQPLKSVFFLIDTSGRMEEQAIEAVNMAMREAIPIVKEIAMVDADNAIRYNVLEFSTLAKWMNNDSVTIENFKWKDLSAYGLRSLGEAYRRLNEKLTRRNGGFLQEQANYAPIIILLLAGTPTDDVETGLAVLRENKWFLHAFKIAIKFQEYEGFDFYHQILLDFAGEDWVVVANPKNLKQYIKMIAINAVMVGKRPRRIADIIPYIDIEDYKEYDSFESLFNNIDY